MFERDNRKKDNESILTEELVEQENNYEEKKKSEVESKKEIEGRFIIKKSSKRNISILNKIDIQQLIEKYPILEGIKELEKSNTPLLVISELAENRIKEHISWGMKTIENIYEQGGILIGKPFLVGNSILGIVEYVIPADLSHASTAYLEMGTETWMKMLNIYDEQYKEQGLYVIGWFHTHPNNLPVFMSYTDMETQRAFFNQDWHFSIVLNPHKQLIACFNSAKANRCEYYPVDFVDR